MALHDAGVLSALVCAIFGDDEPPRVDRLAEWHQRPRNAARFLVEGLPQLVISSITWSNTLDGTRCSAHFWQ